MGASASATTTRSRRAGRAGADRSERGEERALKACRRLPWWCLGATRTRHHSQLDRWGIDIVIETVDLDDSMCDATVYGTVLGVCIRAREEAIAAGLTCDDARLCRKEAA